MRVISVADPEHPEELGYYDTFGTAMDVAVSGDYAYVAEGRSGLRVISVAAPRHPEEVGYYDTGYAYGVAVSGDYAYVADNESGLRVISVADPEHPEEVGYYDTPGSALGVALSEDGLIWVADKTNLGIYRFTDSNEVKDPFILHPSSFILYSAYPNPFNSMTSLSYGLPLASDVSVQVYDARGQFITTLVDNKLTAGRYTVMWNGLDAPAGVYLVQMKADAFSAVQKVVLVK